MPRVFISHSTRDRDFVEREIIDHLGKAGVETWYSKDNIQTAEQWERSILKGLESCDWFLIVLSPHSEVSEWVKDELNWAIPNRVGRIIPVLIADCDPWKFHIRLNRLQFADFRRDQRQARERVFQCLGLTLAPYGSDGAPSEASGPIVTDSAPDHSARQSQPPPGGRTKTVTVQCPTCQAQLSIPDGRLDRPGRCPKCRSTFTPAGETRMPGGRSEETSAWNEPGPSPSGGGLPLGKLFGRYRVDRVLGKGGMGEVYLAFDTNLRRFVALKIPFSKGYEREESDRLLYEARAAANLRHPNFCPIYEADQVDGRMYLALAYIEGRTLDTMLRDLDGRLSPRSSAGMVRTLALALAHAHDVGVVHRDLKPSNIMVDARDTLIIMDFGLSLRLNTDDPRLSQAGRGFGTRLYISPEQALGDLDAIGPPTDIYTLGVIFYELLAGRCPFVGPKDIVAQHLMELPPPLSTIRDGIDPALEAICMKALAKKIPDRHATMLDFAAALAGWLHEAGPSEAVVPPIWPAPEPPPNVVEPRVHVPTTPATSTGPTGVTMARIPAGDFLMGSDPDDKDAFDDEKPRHRVRISQPFLLGIYPVTQAQFWKVMGTNPSRYAGPPPSVSNSSSSSSSSSGLLSSSRVTATGALPVESVTWFQSIEFCNRLSRLEGLACFYAVIGEQVTPLGGVGYRLPTEAEWEYACLGGTSGAGGYGFPGGAANLGQYGWFDGNSGNRTRPVGQKAPNAWGLYDMHGNVSEWCWDGYAADTYRLSPPTDPEGPSDSIAKVIRGGSWNHLPRYARSSSRRWFAANDRFHALGFRVARFG